MGVGLSINIIAHFGYILAIQNKVFVIWGARHSNILGTEQLINMAFRCIIPIPTQLTWCRKQATGTFHQDCSSEYVSLTALFTQVLEKLVILCKLKKNNHPYSNRFFIFYFKWLISMINQITQKAVIFVWLENQVSPSSSKSKVLTSSPLPSDTTALYEPASFFVTWGGKNHLLCKS